MQCLPFLICFEQDTAFYIIKGSECKREVLKQTTNWQCKNIVLCMMESSSFCLSRIICDSIRMLSLQHWLTHSNLNLYKCQLWMSANIAEILIKIFSSAVKEVKMLDIMCFLVQGRQQQLLGKRWGVGQLQWRSVARIKQRVLQPHSF